MRSTHSFIAAADGARSCSGWSTAADAASTSTTKPCLASSTTLTPVMSAAPMTTAPPSFER